jgi:penicillin-binding protein 2
MDAESPRLRLSILGVVVVSLFGALFARLWYLQVMTAQEFQVQAASNSVREVSEDAPRGRILDRFGTVLVDNRTSLVVTVNQHDLDNATTRANVLLALATELTKAGIPTKVSAIEQRLADKQYNPLQPIPVSIDVPETFQITLAERADEFPGVEVKRESVRTYPQGPLAAHVLGYTGRISADELTAKQGTKDDPKPNDKPYQPDSDIGKSGVEKSYESDLRGTPGKCKLEVDAKGKPVRTTECTAPIPGNDLALSIDSKVQSTLEQNIASELLSVRGRFTSDGNIAKSPAGSGVVLDPRNGQVIAMASFPTYDPSEFVNGISQERYDQLQNSGGPSANPFINRAIGGQYAPGSTFKLITGNAAVSQGLINGGSYINDTGTFKFGTGIFKSAGDSPQGAGELQIPKALTISSDVFFYSLGARYWTERGTWGDGIQQEAKLFGLGAPTGVPLGGEGGGLVLTPDEKNKLHQDDPKDYDAWQGGETVQLAIGQDAVLVTPLQLANAYATFSQHGVRYQPNVVDKVMKPGGDVTNPADVVRVIIPTETARFPIADTTFGPIMQGLSGVPDKNQAGTAGAAFEGFDLKDYPLAGKTGTAQVGTPTNPKADTSLFVGMGPVNNPQYVTTVVLEESGFGADVAAPVVRHVFDELSNPLAAFAPQAPPAAGAPTTSVAPGTPGTPTTPLSLPTTTLPPTTLPRQYGNPKGH